ncbi:MAG TPA: hypothetical protein VFR50_12445 [Casimicrobiaceae bacterium]|jgi:hypothetical protein|nr:hypothetical protein [Casimicrobiaceae bacterium]
MSHAADLVDEVMREITKLAPQLHPHALFEIEARLRKRFGGKRAYIRKKTPGAWLHGARGPWFGRREGYVPSTRVERRR